MTDFNGAFERFLGAVEQDMGAPFTLQRDARVEGRWVALEARFGLESERKIFGLMPTGNMTKCGETCIFLPAETLSEGTMGEMLRYIEQVHDAVVRPDASHEFTMVSLVVAAADWDGAVPKMLKKHAYEKQYKLPQKGWSTVRVAVVNLASGKTLCNRAGVAVRDRLAPTLKKLG